MTTLQGENGKTIQFALNNTIHEIDKNLHIIEMPVVICNNRKDAEHIQQNINLFVSELSKKIIKK